MTPQVVEVCEAKSIAHVVLESFVSAAAVNRAAEAAMVREYTWVRWLDEALADEFPEFRRSGFAPALSQVYFLKRALDWYLVPATVVTEFIAATAPAEITVFERPPFEPVMDGWPPVGRPLHSLLLPMIAPSSVTVKVLPDSRLSGVELLHDRFVPRMYRKLRPKAGALLRRLRSKPGAEMPSGTRVLRTGVKGSDVDDALVLLKTRGIGIVEPPDSFPADAEPSTAIGSRIGEVVTKLMKEPAFWAPVDGVNPSLRRSIESFLCRWLESDMPRAWSQFRRARRWLAAADLAAVVGTDVDSTSTAALLQAAGSLNIPRIIRIHNGGMIQDLPPHDCIGPTQCDSFLVNGLGDVEYFEALGRKYPQLRRGSIVPVGSARLERVSKPPSAETVAALTQRLKAKDSRPIVLYVPTMLMGCYRYFCEGHVSDTAYVALQQRILRVMSEFPQVRVLYKPMNVGWTRDPLRDFIDGLSNVEVISGRLTDLMWAVDAIVVDFSATAITEVVLTDKPLILYQGRDWARMLPEAKAALAHRATISETSEEFERDVREFLQKANFEPVSRRADEFVRLYCTHFDDGRSAVRIADVISGWVSRTAEKTAAAI